MMRLSGRDITFNDFRRSSDKKQARSVVSSPDRSRSSPDENCNRMQNRPLHRVAGISGYPVRLQPKRTSPFNGGQAKKVLWLDTKRKTNTKLVKVRQPYTRL